MWDWAPIAADIKAVIAGGMGGLVRAITLRERMSDAVVSCVVGAVCAYYGAPALHPQLASLGMADDRAYSLSGFLLGIGGIVMVGLVLDGWRAFGRRHNGGGSGE